MPLPKTVRAPLVRPSYLLSSKFSARMDVLFFKVKLSQATQGQTMVRIFFLMATLVFCTTLKADEPDTPGIHETVTCTDGKHTFNLFIPSAYQTKPEKQFPVLYISSPSGNPSFLKLEKWAEEREFILIGINDSKNGAGKAIFAAQDAVLESTAYLRKHHCLQLATGLSGAAWASVKLANRHPKMIAGVLLHAHSGNGAFCEPGQSVTFLYGAKDTIQPPNYVEKAIKIYQHKGFHIATKKLPTGHRWGSLEDTIAMLDHMYSFQRFNNPALTPQDVTSDLEAELEFVLKDANAISREASLFAVLQSISSSPAIARMPASQKAFAAWSDAYIEIVQTHQASPVKAYALMNYSQRLSLIDQLKGDAKSQLKKLTTPILKHESVAKEVAAQSTFDRLIKKEAKLEGRASLTKKLLKQYKKLIANHPGTAAARQAALRITALEGQ